MDATEEINKKGKAPLDYQFYDTLLQDAAHLGKADGW
jgi:hypothetical protein